MGGAVSAGEDNEELVDHLVSADYIKSPLVEAVFRAVDRGFYYTDTHRSTAYRDMAWKKGNLHLSAPCIYSQVLESLQLQPGQSFLNIGSGTGYLSTMVGLVLGHRGINQGIELHADVVEYANKKMDQFLRNSNAMYRFDFCEPQFVVGNGLLISDTRRFDRIYCGASVSRDHESHVKSLLRVGGILVMPMDDQLVQITRTSEDQFTTKNILPVSFAPLIPPSRSQMAGSEVRLPDLQPMSLKTLCGRSILSLVRQIVAQEIRLFEPSQNLEKVRKTDSKKKKYVKRISVAQRLLQPEYMSSSDSADEDDFLMTQFQSVRDSIRNRMRVAAAAATFSDIVNHVIHHESDSSSSASASSSSSSSSTSEWDSGMDSTAAQNKPVDSSPESTGDTRAKRSCSLTEDDEDVGKKASPSTSSSGNFSDEQKIALANAIRNRRRLKLQRLATTSSSSSTSSSPASSASANDRQLVQIEEDKDSDDDEISQGIHLLRVRENDPFVKKMQETIRMLPLPVMLQSFVNLNRAIV